MLPQEGRDVIADDGRKGGLAPAGCRSVVPSQTWRTFLATHVRDLASVNLFTVPTARLRVLFVFVVLAHHRRGAIRFNVTEHPTAH